MNNNALTGGIIADTNDRILSGNISTTVINFDRVDWGQIEGDISDQTDLINKLDEKEDITSVKIDKFFEENPDYQNRYLISMDNQPVNSVKDYLQLIIDDRVGNDSLWIPFDTDILCLIIDASGTKLEKAIRFFIPVTGMTGVVDLTDQSGLVKFIYKHIDEVSATEWSDIQGSVFDNPELAAVLNAKLNKTDNITIEEVRSLFN